ncbi:hypothetical protein Zmor_000724 [Zophobas morio]|uniref:Uncharacterized protein n=1 Tax=Zophobas morio TaxID=2755281 RepID=A0AA38IXM0_9CUCU|nr:hypothetical protein Zmor_000724 [Zophobas morio]
MVWLMSAFQIARFRVRQHLHQWYSISKIKVPSSVKLTNVIRVRPKEYCKLKHKFWHGSKKSPTSALADLQLKLEFHSLWKGQGLYPYHAQKVQALIFHLVQFTHHCISGIASMVVHGGFVPFDF